MEGDPTLGMVREQAIVTGGMWAGFVHAPPKNPGRFNAVGREGQCVGFDSARLPTEPPACYRASWHYPDRTHTGR